MAKDVIFSEKPPAPKYCGGSTSFNEKALQQFAFAYAYAKACSKNESAQHRPLDDAHAFDKMGKEVSVFDSARNEWIQGTVTNIVFACGAWNYGVRPFEQDNKLIWSNDVR